MLAVGSSVLTKKSSGVISSESPTHWTILGFAGTFEEGPLRVTSHKKGRKDVQPFLVPGAVTLSAMQDVYNAAMPHLQQKSAKAHAVLLSLLGQTKGTTTMAISKERAAAYKAAGDSALKVAKEQEAKKAAEKNPAPTKAAKPTPAKAAKPAKAEKPAAKPAKVAAEPSGKPGRGRKAADPTTLYTTTEAATGVKRGDLKKFVEFATSVDSFSLTSLLGKFGKVEGFDQARIKRYFDWCRTKGIFAPVQ